MLSLVIRSRYVGAASPPPPTRQPLRSSKYPTAPVMTSTTTTTALTVNACITDSEGVPDEGKHPSPIQHDEPREERHDRHGLGRALQDRHVEMGLIWLIETIGLDVADDAGNRHPRRIRSATAPLDAMPDGITICKEAVHQRFVNQYNVRGFIVIAVRKQSPAHKWCVQNAKVVRADPEGIRHQLGVAGEGPRPQLPFKILKRS